METRTEIVHPAPTMVGADDVAGANPAPPTASHAARLRRVHDYQARSLEKSDSLEANLGSINSGLMCVALWLDEMIEHAMASGPRDIERLARIFPAIEMHLRVTRQVDRFAQIELRAQEARQPKPPSPQAAVPCLEHSVQGDIGQSEDSES
ncbi:hypothetical protein [Planctomicrobium piriforme]|uniref:Uncharacterized protein n=1 Tax=Planctomicrobium piriforme TaxID=1576369 RepID=A0A1I3R5H1_9PLAN|nr:hypothetical protein [Planctomicrobium piriforme]SFJ41854.1 hypothetical protein SAMN05421753_12019 [Planctomicrobium piriforme]